MPDHPSDPLVSRTTSRRDGTVRSLISDVRLEMTPRDAHKNAGLGEAARPVDTRIYLTFLPFEATARTADRAGQTIHGRFRVDDHHERFEMTT